MASQTIEKMSAEGADLKMLETSATIAGVSLGVQMVESAIAELAPTNIPILIVGESGTGKEMFANLIHRLSRHRNGPLTKLRCASMTPENFNGELAVTASRERGTDPAELGSIYLDEIGDLDPVCQRTLLCALPDGDMTRPGILRSRTIATTGRNLEEEMRTGRFRSELYYRIAGVCLRLPALRDRKEDIPPLVEFFLTKHAAQFGRERLELSSGAMDKLINHSWPGNIRELENVIKKIVALGDERFAIAEIGPKPAEASRSQAPGETGSSLKVAAKAASRMAERELILKALARTRWNRKRAAQELQISYKSLLYKLKQIGVEEAETN